jgi:hypothetical protein
MPVVSHCPRRLVSRVYVQSNVDLCISETIDYLLLGRLSTHLLNRNEFATSLRALEIWNIPNQATSNAKFSIIDLIRGFIPMTLYSFLKQELSE